MNTTTLAVEHAPVTFSSAEVCRITGVTTMQINHWDRLGIVKPSVRPADGTGSRRLYSHDDLAAVEIARRLRTVNIRLDCLDTAMRNLLAAWPRPSTVTANVLVLIRPDGSCDPVTGDTQLAAMLATHRAGIVLDLAGVVRDLRARLLSPPAAKPKTPVSRAPARRPGPKASSWGEDW